MAWPGDGSEGGSNNCLHTAAVGLDTAAAADTAADILDTAADTEHFVDAVVLGLFHPAPSPHLQQQSAKLNDEHAGDVDAGDNPSHDQLAEHSAGC